MAAPTLSAPGVIDITATSARPQVTLTYAAGVTEAQIVASLFGSTEAGGLWLPGPTTCFTDTAGTTAAGANDTVARINDGSGNANHATQATADARPILRQSAGGYWYLEFDGIDDYLILNTPWSISFDAATVFALMYASTVNNKNYLIADRTGGGDNRFYFANGIIAKNTAATFTPVVGAHVFTGQWIASGASMRVNQSSVATVTNSTANTRDITWIGRGVFVTTDLDGDVYGFAIVDRTVTAGEVADAESFFADRAGITL